MHCQSGQYCNIQNVGLGHRHLVNSYSAYSTQQYACISAIKPAVRHDISLPSVNTTRNHKINIKH